MKKLDPGRHAGGADRRGLYGWRLRSGLRDHSRACSCRWYASWTRANEHADFKSQLQELVQARPGQMPGYTVVREEGPDHDKTFWVQLQRHGHRNRGHGQEQESRRAGCGAQGPGSAQAAMTTACRGIRTHRCPAERCSHGRAHDRRPFIVPVFIPHAGCPHRCVFCNQSRRHRPARQARRRALKTARVRRRIPADSAAAAAGRPRSPFSGAISWACPHERHPRACWPRPSEWVHDGDLDGIRFSTRPDTVNPQDLGPDRRLPGTSAWSWAPSPWTMKCSANPGAATPQPTRWPPCSVLKDRGYEIGLQLMVGLPGDDEAGLLETGRRIADLDPAFVRIYPTLVLAGSLLAEWFRAGRYRPLSLDAGRRALR
ncbi:MAG: hypothetical protein MZV70_18105 [Desulfobacterales bacterium]|nr:hypothetical protein [Desulfobacterales bacterium]